MIYMTTSSNDPTWNLAFEEYCLTDLAREEPILLLWQNANSVIVGRYQNIAAEIDVEAAKELGVRVVRRSTGGGAVYHDLGNLNYSLITPCPNPEKLDLAVISAPVLHALQAAGVPVIASGRNDLLLNGKKISGTAQTLKNRYLLHHGTLLYDSNMSVLTKVLKPDPAKLKSKGITSVKSRVCNIKEEMGWTMDVSEFWDLLLKGFGPLKEMQLTEKDLECITLLQEEKYAAWDWTVREPECTYYNEQRFPEGKLSLSITVMKNDIRQCRISGDFLGLTDIQPLENALSGCHFDPASVSDRLSAFPLNLYLGGITLKQFLQCMFQQVTVSISE